jgi:hypothetical protein
LIAELCTAFGLPEPNIGSFSLDGGFLADRTRRYLVQHPYIQTLVLNCFNAGRGRLLAEMLLARIFHGRILFLRFADFGSEKLFLLLLFLEIKHSVCRWTCF